MKKEQGITMVTLVVTIIILIILAGVSINTLIGDNGIIRKTKQARENIIYAGQEEQKQLNQLFWEMEQEGIYSEDEEKANQALEMVEDIVRDVEVGQIYYGTVTKLTSFGAFVDLGVNGKEGLLHISKISNERIKNIEDVLKVGDKVTVKVIDIDDQDRINLSMKDLTDE